MQPQYIRDSFLSPQQVSHASYGSRPDLRARSSRFRAPSSNRMEKQRR